MRLINLLCSFLALSLSVTAAPIAMADAAVEQLQSSRRIGNLPATNAPTVLTIAGNGHWYQVHYDAGDIPSLSSYDSSGELLPDGLYRYELRILATNPGVSILESASTDGLFGNRNQKPPRVFSGSFKVSGGLVEYE